jgi:hypothetical protein
LYVFFSARKAVTTGSQMPADLAAHSPTVLRH